MAKAWSFDEACTIAGELYGNVLARNSDDAGYKHTVNQLNSGNESVERSLGGSAHPKSFVRSIS